LNNITPDLPDLKGCVCTRLVCQQYWYNGELEEEANVTFLQVDGKQWHSFLIDCGEPFWKVVDKPDEWNTSPAEEFHYPQVELTERWGLFGRTIQAVKFVEIGMASEFRVLFAGDIALVLHDENDNNTLFVRPVPTTVDEAV